MQRGWLRLAQVARTQRAHAPLAVRAISASASLSTGSQSVRKAASRNSSSSPRRTPRTQVISDLDALVHEAKRRGARSQPSTDFLRRAGAALQLCKSREQCTAAIPLCHVVQRAEKPHGKVEMECVRILQKAGRNMEVVALADHLMKQDVFLLNPSLASAIQACAALGDVDQGFKFFDDAVQRGSIPNLSVYSALLAVAGAAGDPQRVQDVLGQMQEAGVEMNHITFHNLMSAYARAGHVTEALSLFDKMRKQGINADEHTYAILMDAHAENGDFESAKRVMDELQKTTIKPNLVHYNVLLKACGKVSNLTSAFQLYEEMKQRKIQPDLVTFITMMHAVYHGELGAIDQRKVKAALVGMGLMGAGFVPFINYEEYMMTTLFCGSLVGSMGLAAYMNPDGVIRALYPNTDEPRDDTIIEAFFRRLREEDHCGRSMYLWREMLKFNVPADPRVYDVLVRTCVRKRHPELAYEAVFEEKLPITDKEGAFVLSLPTTLGLLHSLLAQKRAHMADTLYEAARSQKVFDKVFSEKGDAYVYDMRSFLNEQVRSYTIIKLMDELRAKVDSSKGEFVAPNVQFLVQHGYELLDRIDADNASLRTLFSMDDMIRVGASSDTSTSAYYYFRLSVPTERLQKYFETTPANAVLVHQSQLSMTSGGIQVSCRVRQENDGDCSPCVSVDTSVRRLVVAHPSVSIASNPALSRLEAGSGNGGTAYSCFDGVYSGQSNQEKVFESIGQPFVADLIAGYNCTIMAYGQTGSGKTYTTVGGSTPETRGLVPRAMESILAEMARFDPGEYDVALTASFIEIYQEKLRDLLLPHKLRPLRLREDKERDVVIEGASEIAISTLAGGLAVLSRGNSQRSTGSTLMNADSSRSHSVLILTFTKKHIESNTKVRGKLFIVDLAGSEKVQKTAATGVRMEEAKHINRSLSALGNVINALTDEKVKHIPYRDSKLTRLLQTSLGGNAKTHLLLTCSASSLHIEETLSTLRFGARAKNIQNSPHVNNENAGAAAEYGELLTTLQSKIENLHSYIRHLEMTRCETCKARVAVDSTDQEQGRTTSAVDANNDVAVPDPVDEDPADPHEGDCEFIADDLMRAEMRSLRKALTSMKRDHEAQDHAHIVARTMMEVTEQQLDSRHRSQEQMIQQQKLELQDASATTTRLEKKMELLEGSVRDMSAELHRLRKLQLREQAGESAEAEILRRHLDASTKLAKQLQAKLTASQQERESIEDLKTRLVSKEHELRLLRTEMEVLHSRKMPISVPTAGLVGLPSPHRVPQTRPVTAVDLKTLAAIGTACWNDAKHLNSGTNNIQSWWSGAMDEPPPRNQEESAENRVVETVQLSPVTKSPGATRTESYGDHNSRDSLPPTENAASRVCNSANSSTRPFRARLVGLLNSLEEETTAYRELVVETKERAVSRRESRPRGQLPCL